jgi:hypothetical protein
LYVGILEDHPHGAPERQREGVIQHVLFGNVVAPK